MISPSPSPVEPGTRLPRTLTLFMLLLTFLFAAMAYSSWTGGEPAPASMFAPRAKATVTAATVRSGAVNGSQKYLPLVTVEWPQSSGISRALAGLEPSFFAARKDAAEAITARYKVGDTITVRVSEGRPIADRNDAFRIGHAIFLSLFSAVAGLFTYVFFHASRAHRKART